jgi:predicted transcriptional regulator
MARFTPGELEVMQVLWRASPLKPAEIESRLNRPIGNAALRSVLRVLLEKGHVKRSRRGKAYFYRPARPAATSFRQMVRRLADTFCNGSSFDLIAQLIKAEKLSPEDIHRLQEFARGEPTDDPPPRGDKP